MSDPQGIDSNPLIWRLHDGLREFQSWRNHRRQRGADSGPPEPSPVIVAPTPSTGGAVNAGGIPGAGLEPQGFVSVGGRLVPLFGELHPVNATLPTPPSAAKVAEHFAPPPLPPTSETKRAPEPSRLATAKPLNLPVPTPPQCLGLPSQPAPPPGTGESTTAPAASPKPDPTDAASTTTQAAHDSRPRMDVEVQRLEQVQTEHRTLLATLLNEHREMLRAQAEAAAAKHDQVVRELFAEHRAELGKVLVAHSEHIRDLLVQHREQEQRTTENADHTVERHAATVADLSELLAKHAEVQAQDHEQTTQHIDNLSSFIGDLTQTISLLAMATYAEKPAAAAPAPSPQVEPPAIAPATSLPRPVSTAPSPEPHTLTAPTATEPEPSAIPTKPASCDSTLGSPSIAARSSPTASGPPGSRRTDVARYHDNRVVQAHIDDFIRECGDDDELSQGIEDPEGPHRRSPLPPVTPRDVDEEPEAANA